LILDPIIAGFNEVESGKDSQQLNVLFLTNDPSHYRHALIMANNSTFNCFIMTRINSRFIVESDFGKAKVIFDYKDCVAVLSAMDRLIVPVFNVAPTYKSEIKKIIALAIRCHIPVVNIPHGLFEPRNSMVDSSSLITSTSQIFGLGACARSFADCSLSWYEGEGAIGYPHTMVDRQHQTRILPRYTLITTNSNWYLYHFADRRRLFESLFSFIEQHDERTFIWAMHPAEQSVRNFYARFAKMRRPRNLFVYGMNEDIYFHGLDTTEDLIFHCEAGISTTTTCLLDFELYNKPVHVFDCEGTKKLTDSFKEVSLFREPEDLEQEAKPVITGRLKPYRPDLFDKHVKEASVTLGQERAYLLEASAV